MVPWGGIEPPTRGFSIRCSTPELPGRAIWGSGYLTKASGLVHADFSALRVIVIRRPATGLRRVVRIFNRGARNRVAAIEPAAEIGIGAALRTERPVLGLHGLFAAAGT